ncbi:universal stress protein [Aliikangiella marina]|nr:universal stress protein [Aliikangiella marina]
MYKSQNVLVVVDFRQEKHHALPRALELAKRFGSQLTVITCVYQHIVDLVPNGSGIDLERIRHEATAHYENELRDMVNPLIEAGFQVDADIHFEVLWSKSFSEGLLQYVSANNFDLVVKTAHQHGTLEKVFFTPTDWHLLRDCETNILFVKKGAWPSSTNILGAINIEDDEAHQRLNHDIVNATAAIAESCQSDGHILNVFPWAKIDLDKFKYLFDKEDQFLAIKNIHRKQVEAFVKDYPSLLDNIIIAEGLEPDETIPEIIKSTFSDLLIMGCVRRRGFAGMVIGNTVEKILDDINCEVLVLK